MMIRIRFCTFRSFKFNGVTYYYETCVMRIDIRKLKGVYDWVACLTNEITWEEEEDLLKMGVLA